MIQTLSTYAAASMLKDDQYANWSMAGATAIVEHLEQLEEETGTPIEMDVVAIRCDYSEYETAVEAATEYGFEVDDEEDEEEQEEAAIKWLEERTTVIQFTGGVIVQAH